MEASDLATGQLVNIQKAAAARTIPTDNVDRLAYIALMVVDYMAANALAAKQQQHARGFNTDRGS